MGYRVAAQLKILRQFGDKEGGFLLFYKLEVRDANGSKYGFYEFSQIIQAQLVVKLFFYELINLKIKLNSFASVQD